MNPKRTVKSELPVLAFRSATELMVWLEENHATSPKIRVRIYRKNSGIPSVTFEEVLDEGLCFGWSESMWQRGDEDSYLPKFTPRKTTGTVSERNRQHAMRLLREGRMKPFGLSALGMPADTGTDDPPQDITAAFFGGLPVVRQGMTGNFLPSPETLLHAPWQQRSRRGHTHR